MLINIIPFPLNVPQGSKVYVYDAGTVNEADVYSDTYYTAASQPLTADSYGRVAALAEEGAYDVKVCDGNTDALLYSIERIIASGAFCDAPSDSKEYVRKNGNWVESTKGLYGSNETLKYGGQ